MSDSCDSVECSLPGSSVQGILQARILEWVAIPFSKYIKQCKTMHIPLALKYIIAKKKKKPPQSYKLQQIFNL